MVSQSKMIINSPLYFCYYSLKKQSSEKDDIVGTIKSIINKKKKELKSIDKELPKKLESLIILTEKYETDKLRQENEDYKKKLSEKDKEISELKDKLKIYVKEEPPVINQEQEIKEEKEKEKEKKKVKKTKKKKEKNEIKETNEIKEINEVKEIKEETEIKEKKEIKESNNEDISKEQTEKEEESKKTKKKVKKKKKKKKDEETTEEKKDENISINKEENSKQTEIILDNKEKENTEDNKDNTEDNRDNTEDKKENTEEKKEITEETKENFEIKDMRDINININNENENNINLLKEPEPDYKEEYLKLKNMLDDYEQGNIISEKTKSDIDLLKTESLSQINELRAKIEELNTNNLSKFKEYETLISTANVELSQKSRKIKEYETIALKQEDRIDKLNKHIYNLNEAIFHKDLSMKQNETYSNQLINIINEHKLQIKKMKEQKLQEENAEISMLRRQNKNLQNELEIDQKIMQNMKINHQNLQDKYLTICYNAKRKEQEDLIKQAKNLKVEHLTKINNKALSMNRSSSIGMLGISKFKVVKNKNKVNDIRLKRRELNLPGINLVNKSFENGDINKLLFKEGKKLDFQSEFNKNLDEINNKLKQIIDESQKNIAFFKRKIM